MRLMIGGFTMPGLRQLPTDADIEFMRTLEDDFKAQTGLKYRSQFKIFYGPIWRPPIVVLGINPGGDPAAIAPDGVHYRDGRNSRAASSDGYCENGENDLVDCTWSENTGLLKLLMPILGSPNVIRRNVVKTNLAFVRLKNTKDRRTIDRSKDQSAPFLDRILERVLPELILLTGVKLYDFGNRHCSEVNELSNREKEQSVNQPVICPARVRLRSGHTCIAVEVAHASQFSWIYGKYCVAPKINALLNDRSMSETRTGETSQVMSRSNSMANEEVGPSRDAPIASELSGAASIEGVQVDRVGPEQTKPILEELKRLGLDDKDYKEFLHHKQHSMNRMLKYQAATYTGMENKVLHRKLAWMLRACQAMNIQPGSTDELRKLAIETSKAGWTPDAAG